MTHRIKHILVLTALIVGLAGAAQAGCYADYKAKQDNPLKLHYGVVELPDTACGSTDAAAGQIAARVAADGWTLLNVLSIFDANGLDQRRESAGQYYLRY